MHKLSIKTQFGLFTAWFSETGLARLDFPDSNPKTVPETNPASLPPSIRHWAALANTALQQLLAGVPATTMPPLDLSAGTPFQQRVWRALQHIPFGHTCTYSDLGASLQLPSAARAVGSACGANPIPVFIPCHRVLPKGGGLGGFSAGLPWKERLLVAEGILLATAAA